VEKFVDFFRESAAKFRILPLANPPPLLVDGQSPYFCWSSEEPTRVRGGLPYRHKAREIKGAFHNP
jgi:hypothetical protein